MVSGGYACTHKKKTKTEQNTQNPCLYPQPMKRNIQ
uniref:Uncharacterized protein n=1 Tax=Anguilla anguilla TaxID=7936 RepID=A0A0E9VNC3_ANGAN